MSPLMKARLLAVWIVLSILFIPWNAAAQSASANPVNVLRSFYEAFNDRRIDKAMTYVADSVVFSWPGIGTFSGKSKVRELLQNQARAGWTFKLSEFRDNSGRVTYGYEIYVGGNLVFSASDGVTIVRNARIIFDGTEATAPR